MAVVKKQRIDKYYNLAKLKGYRARSSFKLLEINKKYNFLKDCRIAVDLCAAPGGWLQILMQEMPVTRKIIGIDLDPIHRLGDCVTFQADITTIECRRELVYQLDNHKADIFVHDGAPTFGTDNEKDYFVQNDLVLSALKLATEFLKEKGIFVTKIHRSENFNKIVNLLQSLFKRVNFTKPLSSRSESTEIFAVCREYTNPEFIDPKLFESGFLFKNDEEEEDQYKKIYFTDFILADKPLELLKNSGEILIDYNVSILTAEMKEYMKDLKLLGIKEMREIIRMQRKVRKKIRNGEYEGIPEKWSILIKEEKEEEEIEQKEAIDVLEEELKKLEKKRNREINKKKEAEEFFNDKIFSMENTFSKMHLNSNEEVKEEINEEVNEEIIKEDSSCSTDFSMTSSEMQCLILLKEDPEKFKESSIGREMIESDDELLPDEARSSHFQAVRKSKKQRKKEMEALGRKKMRALRRSNKIMKDIVIEDEEEEAIIHKKVYKNQLKRQRRQKRLVFANVKGGPKYIPRGKGKILRLDSRMKHDLYREKNKKKLKRKK
ncbi:hypothetical protein NUSPORA_01186 [Nucleospora cyclopteri]